MCDNCGCSYSHPEITLLDSEQHCHAPKEYSTQILSRTLQVEMDVLDKNNKAAAQNRQYFQERGIFALNMVSSPGSGKTTILESSIASMKKKIPIAVIEGDQQTLRDAERIDATGVNVVQVNTGTGCHLDGAMISNALAELKPANNSLLFIENVGNLVCPALFDLGEASKVVIISVTEGEDKPLKYPHMFHASQICVINKVDLLPYVDFSVQKCREYALRVNPGLHFFEVSATTGQGMSDWFSWLGKRAEELAVS